MKICIAIIVSVFLTASGMAEGGISWVDVSQRLGKDCPKLLGAIQQCFDVSPAGIALRLGPKSIDVIEGKSEAGARVPPYVFDCKVKGTDGSHMLTIEISDWDDGWKFIIREKQQKKPVE